MDRSLKKFRLAAAAFCVIFVARCLNARAADPSAAPAAPDAPAATPAQTGELDLTFNQRSPLSTPKELARRLSLKPADLGDDYDLSQRPFKAYVPPNFDPATPCGIILYLGYKDTVSSPPEWHPFLDESHLIFISPVSHSGPQYLPSIPLWHTVGLALDAVANLKNRYAINNKRVYLMSWNTQAAFAAADVFTGMIIVDNSYFTRLTLPNGSHYAANFPPPPADLLRAAKSRGLIMVDNSGGGVAAAEKLLLATMKQQGFTHLFLENLSLTDDLHFPHLKLDWFKQQAIPFLDSVPLASPAPPALSNSPATPGSNPPPPAGPTPPAAAPPAPAPPDPAAHLLSMAKLYIQNGRPDLARTNLQKILDNYPDSPSAAPAKLLLQTLPDQ